MYHLSDLFEALVNPGFGALDARLAEVDSVGQERATGMDALGIAAFFQFDAFGFEKLAEIFVKFVFFDRFHNVSLSVGQNSQT